MANIDDFGVTPSLLNSVLNPAQLPNSYMIGPLVTGSSGTGASSGVFTSSAFALTPSAVIDFKLLLPTGNYFTITSNGSGTVTVDDGNTSLSSYAGVSWQITARNAIATADAMNSVRRTVGEIKSMLPEKYRKMLYRIEGEQIVRSASYFQGTAHTSYKISNTNTAYLWRNFNGTFINRDINRALASPLDKTQGLTTYSDYTLGTASTTVITFQLGGQTNNSGKLAKSDMIIADYDHVLPTVPKILQELALYKSTYKILWQSGVGIDEIPPNIKSFGEWADKILDMLMKGIIGIDEFNQIYLYQESRVDEQVGWGTFAHMRD